MPVPNAVADPAAAKVPAVGSAVASVLSIAQEWAMGLLGVPIGVPLAAFAGVLYGLSFRDPMRPLALWGNVVIATVISSVAAPLTTLVVLHYVGAPATGASGVMAGVAAVLGFGTQYLRPWLRARRDRMLNRAVDRVLGAPAHHGEDGDRNEEGGA